jgi:hypothetical protein
MASETPKGRSERHIAAIVDAMLGQFGTDAVRVAESQLADASGEAAAVWLTILNLLSVQGDARLSDES